MADIPIHESAAPERLEAALIKSLRAGQLPGRMLYQGPEQARRWLAYHQAWSPSRADEAMGRIYAEAFAGAAQAFAGAEGAEDTALAFAGAAEAMHTKNAGKGRALHVVGLGCGGGQKDSALLLAAREAMGEEGALAYFPLDASAELVREAAGQVAAAVDGAKAAIPIHPLVADLGAYGDLSGWLDSAEKDGKDGKDRASGQNTAPRLFTCFGMVPNFDAADLLPYLHGLLRPWDGLLISANLSPRGMEADRERILPQYNNGLALRWFAGALEALEGLGLAPAAERLQEDALQVSARALAADGSIWQIVVEAELHQAASLRVGRQEITLQAGSRLRLFFSNRYTRDAFADALAAAKLKPVQEWLHPGGEEGVFFCRRP